jgi:transcriptional regulator with XRE-family HTH domain
MQICMKMDRISSAKLTAQISAAYSRRGLSFSEIGRACGVHSSQVSRICRGEFKTLSYNVVQVCKVLGLELETLKVEEPALSALRQRLERSVLEVWDETPEDAERIAAFLRQLLDLRRTGSRGSP